MPQRNKDSEFHGPNFLRFTPEMSLISMESWSTRQLLTDSPQR
jgi:hypothetical protein